MDISKGKESGKNTTIGSVGKNASSKNEGKIAISTAEGVARVRVTKGGRNLILLALGAIVISVVLTVVSVAVYHYSGDIYLDRSRPGFLPDDEEVETEEETEEGEYSFGKSGVITGEVLNEYLEKLKVEIEALDEYKNPFDAEALSDEHFGL